MKEFDDLLEELSNGKAEIKLTREVGDDGFRFEAQASGESMLEAYEHFTACLLEYMLKSGMNEDNAMRTIVKHHVKGVSDYFSGDYDVKVRNFERIYPCNGGSKKC